MRDIEALLEERRGYLVSGKKDRVAQVDAELARCGYAVEDRKPAEVSAEIESPEDHPAPVETAVKRGPGRPRKS